MRRFYLLLGLGLTLVLLGLSLHVAQANQTRAGGPPLSARGAVAGAVLTSTASPTPGAEPELAILQYVLAQHSDWNCQGLSGTPGHRQLNDCHPFGYFSHPTTGYVDNYGSPGAAEAAWQARRTQAQSYPIFADESYGGYPGYHAGDTNYPYAHYENYFWGDVWVMSGVSSDDTAFRGSPYVASAIFQAAQALGYLGNPTPTVISTPLTATPLPTTRTPTATPTSSGPPVCEVFTTGASAGCTPPDTYTYSFSFSNITCPVAGNVLVSFAVGPTDQGPWTIYDSQSYPNHVFPVGGSNLSGTFAEPNIPQTYQWFEVWISGVPGPPLTQITPYPLCDGAGGTVTTTPSPATATPTATPTASANPSYVCEVEVSAGTTTACDLPDTYSYDFTLSSSCWYSVTVSLRVEFQVAPDSGGSWATYDQRDLPMSVPPGQTHVQGNFVERAIPTRYHAYRMTLTGVLNSYTAGPGAVCTAALPTVTPCPVGYSDVPPANAFYSYINCLACRGLISGYADGTFRPYASVTRGQVAKIVAGAAGYSDPIPAGRQSFADVPPANPFWLPIERIYLHATISGYTCGGSGEPCDAQHRPYFRPSTNVTRGQLAKIATGARGWPPFSPTTGTFADVQPGTAFYEFVEVASLHGVISGYACGGPSELCDDQHRPYYRAGASVTRGQAAKIIANTFFPDCQPPAP